MKRTGSERPPPVLTPAEHPHRHSSRKVIERVPFTSGLVLCLTLVVFGTSFVALEDTSWAIAGGDGGYRMALHRAPVAYRVGLRRVHDSQGSPLLLADLCADEVALTLGSARSSGPRLLASSRSRLGPWCTCARLGRWVQWMLYGTCFFSLAAAGLAIIADTHVRRSKRLRHQPVVAGSGPSVGSWTTISNPMLVSTVLSWVCAWLLLLLSLLTWAVFAPHSVLLGTSGEPLALKVGGIYVWLRHALALATFFGATILAALLGVWTEQDLVHAVVTLMRCSRVVKLTYLMLVLQLLLIALAPVTGVGGEAMLCAAGLYALHEQQARPKLLEWYLALLSCFCVISTVDVISARPCISQVIATLTACNTETFVQEAQLGLKLAVFALLALELWPASWGGRLSEMRRRDTFSGDPDASPGAQASPCSLGSRRGRRDQLGVPPWLFHVGVLLWDGSYLLSSLADIISDVAVMWQWNRVGMHGHFAVGVAVFASTSVWYTMFFVLLLVTSGSSSAPDSTDSAPSSDSNAGGESARKRRPHAPTALQRLANCVKARVGVSRVSMLALFLALLPFGQAFPFLVYGMLRAAPPELIREYAVRVLGGSAARLLADDDFFDWSMSLLPYAPFLVETLCEAIPMSLVQLSAIVSVDHQDQVGALQLGSIAISVSVIVTRAVMLAFSFSTHVTVFKAFCLAADVLLTFYTVAALFGTSHTFVRDAATAPSAWFVWFWQAMPSVSPLGAVWCWIWLCFLLWLGAAALALLLAWHTHRPEGEDRSVSLASRALAETVEADGARASHGRVSSRAAVGVPPSRGCAVGLALLAVLEDTLLAAALLALAVGPLLVLLGTLTFSWLVLAVMLFEPQYGGPSQPWARRAVSDFVASDLAAKALIRLATVDGLAQCALSAWYPGQLDETARAEEVAAAARLARNPLADLDALNAALNVSVKWALFLAASRDALHARLVEPLEARCSKWTRLLLRGFFALGLFLYACAKAYTLLFPFLSFFLEQTVSGAISQGTFVAMLGCLLGMLLLRHSYGRYMLICSVYAGMLLDLPAIVTDKLALLARVREPPAASSASGARQVRLTSYSLAMSEAERRAPSGGEEEEEGDDLPRSEEDAWEAASTRGKPFLLRERAPRATQEGMAPVPTRTGGSVHPLYLSTANGGKVLERLHRRALHEVYRASLYDTAIKLSFAKLNRPSASESSESQDGSADDAEAGRSTPSERQVSLALVRELDALYLHMRERDADVLVRIAVERLCTCLFRLSSDGMGAREAVAEAEAEAEAEWMARTPPSQPSRRPTIPIERPEPGAVEEEGRLCAPNEGATAEGGGEAAAEMIC